MIIEHERVMTMNEIKPCPYCHFRPWVHMRREPLSKYWQNLYEYKVSCMADGCNINPETEWCETEGAAIEEWNLKTTNRINRK